VTLKDTLQKFIICPGAYTVPDMKALVMTVTNSSDSPVKENRSIYKSNCIMSLTEKSVA
jgi:hypothetical protein